MAARYWVGGTASWDGTAGTKWATVSGGTGGASVPTTADDVFFDAASTGTVTISVPGSAKSINCTGFTGSLTQSATVTVAGDVTLVSGMTFSAIASAAFSITAACTFTSAGKSPSNITVNATGATVQLADALTLGGNGVIVLSAGTFKTNGYSVAAQSLVTSGTTARTFDFGASAVTLSGSFASSVTAINFSGQTNLTFTAGTSQINLTSSSVQITCAVTFYNVAFTSTTFQSTYTISGANSYNNLSFAAQSGGTPGTNIVTFGGNQTVSGTLTIPSGSIRAIRTFIQSDVYSTQRTLSVASLDASSGNCDFAGIAVTGAAAPIAPTSAGDGGNNSGITFTSPKTVYFAQTANGNWNATVWASSVGGTPDQTQFPLPQDTAVFPSGYPSSGGTVTVPSSTINVSAIDASARTSDTMTLAFPNNTRTFFGAYCNGNFTGGSGLTVTVNSSSYPIVFRGGSNITFVQGGSTLPVAFGTQCVSGSFLLGENISSSTSTFLLDGKLDLNGYTLSVKNITGIQAIPRSIAFGSSSITCSGSNVSVFSVSGAAFTYTGTFLIYFTYTGGTGTRNVSFAGYSGSAQNLSVGGSSGFVLSSGATDTFSIAGITLNDVDLTNFSGTFIPGFFGLSVSGNFTAGTTVTLGSSSNSFTFSTTSGTKTITTNGKTINFPVTFASGGSGSWQLQDAMTLGSTITTTLSNGTLDLNGYSLTTGLFNSSNSNTRTIAFGSGNITVNGTGTVWTTSITTSFSRTGTPTVNVANNSATATTVTTGALSEAQSLDFNFTTGTYTLTDTSAVYRSLNLTGFSGTFANNARTYYGAFNAGSTATMTAGTSAQTFAATSGTWGITTNGRTLDFPVTFNGVSGTWQLQGATTIGSTRTTTLTNGSLDLNGYTLTTGLFNTNNTNVRSIAFGTGNITLNGSGTVWSNATTNFSRTGTPTINVSNNSATATTVTTGSLTEAQALDFNYTTGTYTLTDTSSTYRNLNLTGFSGTFGNTPRTIYGSLNVGSTATLSAGTSAQTFAATSGTWGLTTNGKTLDFPITFNGVGGTWQLQDNLTAGSTRAFTLTNGTLDINSKTTSVGIFTVLSGTHAFANGTLNCASVTHTSGDLSVGTGYNINTTGAYTFTAGSITINDGVALPIGSFSSSNSNVRSIAFGAGQISLSGNNTTIWTNSTATNFSYTGTFKVVATYTGSVGTRTLTQGGTAATSQPISTGGSSGFILDTSSTDIKTLTGNWGSIDLTGVTGTYSQGVATCFGNFNAGSTATIASSANTLTFNATSGTQTITSNGRSLDFPITFSGIGGTRQLQDALTSGSSRTITLSSGALDLNGFTLTSGAFNSSGSSVRSIAFNSGNITLNGTGTVWNTGTATAFSYTGTPTVNVSNNSATATTVTTGTLIEAQALDFNYTVGTYTLTDTSAVYRNLNLTGFSGTFPNSVRTIYGDLNVGSTANLTSGTNATTFAATSGTKAITTNGKTLDFPVVFNGVGGTWQLQGATTVGTTRTSTLTNGTIDLNGFTYTTGLFSSNNSNTRVVAFGSGNITISGSGTVWDTGTVTGLSRTGTPTVNISNNSVSATTVTTGTLTEAQSLDFNYTVGTYTLTDTSAVYRSLNLTGFSGTFPNSARTIYGNYNVGSTATLSAGANAQTFAATSGTKTITTNGKTYDFPLTFNGVGGTWQLQDALTMGTGRAFTLTNGTFDANNYNVTVGTVSSNNSLTRTLALGSGTWTVVGTGASAWTFATSTNATVTGTATISMTGATAKTFAGGGLAWPILNQGGAGALTVSGNNTFTDITSTRTAVGPCTISFTAGSTQSVSNFSASGTASGQLTLGSTSTTPYNLVKLGGGDVNVSYCTISYSNVSP